jgi:hypothetical protein
MMRRYSVVVSAAALACALAFAQAAPALAQGDLETPTVTQGITGLGKQVLTITAGSTGCPNGFTVFWMTQADYVGSGSQWWIYGDPRQGEAYFWGTPELNDGGGTYTTFKLAPFQSIEVEIGNLIDESGVTLSDWRTDWDNELEEGTNYMFCAWANPTATMYQSGFSENIEGQTNPHADCTHTSSWWKHNPSQWPVANLTLGTVSYTKAQLIQILGKTAGSNGLIALAKQLIAAKLNILIGANPSSVNATIIAADTQIGSRVAPPVGTGTLTMSSTNVKTNTLGNYNSDCNHIPCMSTVAAPPTWGVLKARYR